MAKEEGAAAVAVTAAREASERGVRHRRNWIEVDELGFRRCDGERGEGGSASSVQPSNNSVEVGPGRKTYGIPGGSGKRCRGSKTCGKYRVNTLASILAFPLTHPARPRGETFLARVGSTEGIASPNLGPSREHENHENRSAPPIPAPPLKVRHLSTVRTRRAYANAKLWGDQACGTS